MSRRAIVGAGILLLWITGLGLLAKRELFRSPVERLARAALLVAPGATYYAVHQDGRHVGFASTTIDTTPRTIVLLDYLVAELPTATGARGRTTARSTVTMTRALRVTEFEIDIEGTTDPVSVRGRVDGDSLVVMSTRRGGALPDTQRVRTRGPVLLPTLLPLAAVLAGDPGVGRSIELPLLEPITARTFAARLTVDAESLIVVHDSASFDSTAGRWVAEQPDTLRAWHLRPAGDDGPRSPFTGWVDEQGRVVETRALGSLVLRRAPFELAWENWRIDQQRAGVAPLDDCAPRGPGTARPAARPHSTACALPPPGTPRQRQEQR